MAHIAAKLAIKPGMTVLDIGCGWGGLALYLHKKTGAEVLGDGGQPGRMRFRLKGEPDEFNGIIRRGAKLLYAYGEATVAKVTVITRKAYGGAYCVMGSKDMGCDVNVAWPTAQIAVMGASGAVGFVYRKQLKDAAEKGEDVDALRLQLQQEYEDTLVNQYMAAERGYVDAVIPPSHTRGYIGTALRLLERKITQTPPKKHGNIPL